MAIISSISENAERKVEPLTPLRGVKGKQSKSRKVETWRSAARGALLRGAVEIGCTLLIRVNPC
jgi:hypothetical protein